MKYSLPKGTFDIMPQVLQANQAWRSTTEWQHLESVMKKLASNYGYQEIRTPIFESSNLFIRGAGETSDIASKEMYTFMDRANRPMSLRPEGTASVIRAFVQENLQQLGGHHKFFYIGPFFRYDRPQAGRYRQFHQFGIEAIGDGSPEQDFETIDLLYQLYTILGIKGLNLQINTLGTPQCRERYQQALSSYLKPYYSSLSTTSQERLSKNPLRILDTKDLKEKEILKSAPSILDYIDINSSQHFQALCVLLQQQQIPFTIESQLVRGLDYYNHTVFEITSDALGAQNTLGAGGRYDGLLPSIGGPDLPCIGFSTGIERILHTLHKQNITAPQPPGPTVALIPLGEPAKQQCFRWLYQLRHANISAIVLETKKLQKSLQHASQKQAHYVVILGDNEIKSESATIKIMQSHSSETIPFSKLINYFIDKEQS